MNHLNNDRRYLLWLVYFARFGSQLHGKQAMTPKDIDARDIGANHRSKNSGLRFRQYVLCWHFSP
jgi:hypothetical protein